MCLKKRFAILLKRSITLLSALSIAVCLGTYSVSAATVNKYDLIDNSYYQGVKIGLDYYTTFPWTSEHSLLLETIKISSTYEPYEFMFGNNGIYFNSDRTYQFSYWVELFNDTAAFSNFYYPDTLQLKIGNKVFTSSAKVLQTTGDSRYTYNFDITIENFEGPFSYVVVIPWKSGASFGLGQDFRASVARQLNLSVTDQSDKVLGGLNSTFGDNYDKPDDSKFDDYKQNEDKLNDSTDSYFDDYENRWFGLGNALGSNVLEFFGFMQFFNLLASIPVIDLILTFSICIGTFGLLLGVVSQLRKG